MDKSVQHFKFVYQQIIQKRTLIGNCVPDLLITEEQALIPKMELMAIHTFMSHGDRATFHPTALLETSARLQKTPNLSNFQSN